MGGMLSQSHWNQSSEAEVAGAAPQAQPEPVVPRKRSDASHLIFSAHGDTNFSVSRCILVDSCEKGTLYYAHCDNFVGVHAVLQAYFSGHISGTRTECHVTHGEEDGSFSGAVDVCRKMRPTDVVFVVDVTAKPEQHYLGSEDICLAASAPHNASVEEKGEFSIEKARHNKDLTQFIVETLGEPQTIDGQPNPAAKLQEPRFLYHLWNDCCDPQANEDESDLYVQYTPHACFLGVHTHPGKLTTRSGDVLVSNGDYNEGPVFCWKRDVDAVASAMEALSAAYEAGRFDSILNVGA